MKQHSNRDGYMIVGFRVNGKEIHQYVHRIVASCFIPNPLGLLEVNHIDNDQTNNIISNLEWCTHQENVAYRETCGISAKEYTKVLRKPLIAINLKTFKVLYFESQAEAERELGIFNSNINAVVKGRKKTAKGYCFLYADSEAVEKARSKFGDEVANRVEELLNEKSKMN